MFQDSFDDVLRFKGVKESVKCDSRKLHKMFQRFFFKTLSMKFCCAIFATRAEGGLV